MLTLIQGHRSARKQKTSVAASSQSFQSIWVDFGIQLRLVDVMNLLHILCRPINIKETETYLRDLIKKKTFNFGLYLDIY